MPYWDADREADQKDLDSANVNKKPAKSVVLMEVLGAKRRFRWKESVESVDFTHSSRKAWSTINRLTENNKPKPCPMSTNSIASILSWKREVERFKSWDKSSSTPDKCRDQASLCPSANVQCPSWLYLHQAATGCYSLPEKQKSSWPRSGALRVSDW